MVDLLRMKPELIEQLAGFLDRETWVRPNWMHLSRELNVDIGVIEELSPYTESSPTIKLFKYLKKYNRPDTIQQLKQALLDMRRDDLCSLLESKGNENRFESRRNPFLDDQKHMPTQTEQWKLIIRRRSSLKASEI